MRILHVINSFHEIGGAEVALSRMIDGMPSDEHFVVALQRQRPKTTSLFTGRVPEIVALGMVSGSSFLPALLALRRHIIVTEPDIIVGWMYHANAIVSGILMTVPGKVPHVWTVQHSLDCWGEERLSTRVAIRVCKRLSNKPDKIVYVANRIKAQHESFGFSPKASLCIPHGVAEVPNVMPRQNNRSRIGLMARWHPAKDHRNFLEALAIVQQKNVSVFSVVAGRDMHNGNADLMKLIGSNSIDTSRVELRDHVTDTATFFRDIDILVLSSVTEGCPLVLIEAMSHGVPCVSTDVGDAKEMLDGVGRIVPTRDPVALAEAILTAIDQSDVLSTSAKVISHVQERYLLIRSLDTYKSVFAEVIDSVV